MNGSKQLQYKSYHHTAVVPISRAYLMMSATRKLIINNAEKMNGSGLKKFSVM